MAEDNLVIIDKREGWAELVLNRPERRNSIIAPLSEALQQALQEVQADDNIRCVILRGEGGFFCSGIDLKALQAEPPPEWRDRQFSSWRSLHLALFEFDKPVIGAFEKYGINAGAALALACDVLIAGETAFLQIGEIQQGSGMPMNAAWLKLKVPEQTADRLAFYGDRVSAGELYRLGLAAECVADDEVVNRCREIAARIGGFPVGASQKVKGDIIKQRGIADSEAFFMNQTSPALLSAGQVKE